MQENTKKIFGDVINEWVVIIAKEIMFLPKGQGGEGAREEAIHFLGADPGI